MIQKRIANVQRYTIDYRFLNKSNSDKAFDDGLNILAKKYGLITMKKTKCDVSDEYEDDTAEETCEQCGKKIQVYLLKPSFCMNCGSVVLPCSMCNDCMGCRDDLHSDKDTKRKNLDNRNLDNRNLDNRNLDNRNLDNRNLDNRNLDNRNLEDLEESSY